MRIPKGMAGVIVVMLALMGSIGAGYLLNGSSAPVVVEDYNFITDVSGLYDYTTVPAYAQYNPAQNIYQYSSSLSDLGTYTSGINFTRSEAANLNPIITPASGLQTVTSSIAYASQTFNNVNAPGNAALMSIPATDYHYATLVNDVELYVDGNYAPGAYGSIIQTDSFTMYAYGGSYNVIDSVYGVRGIRAASLIMSEGVITGSVTTWGEVVQTINAPYTSLLLIAPSGDYCTHYTGSSPFYLLGDSNGVKDFRFVDWCGVAGFTTYISYENGQFKLSNPDLSASLGMIPTLVPDAGPVYMVPSGGVQLTLHNNTNGQEYSYGITGVVVPASISVPTFSQENALDPNVNLVGMFKVGGGNLDYASIQYRASHANTFVNGLNLSIQSVSIDCPTTTINWTRPVVNGGIVQNIGIAVEGTSINDAIQARTTGVIDPETGTLYTTSTNTIGTMTTPVGLISNLKINSNQTVEYDYSWNGSTTHIIKNTNECYIYFWQIRTPTSGTAVPNLLNYTAQYFTNIDYLDPTQGVSLSGSVAYWSNDYSIGAASFLFEKPSAPGSYQFTSFDASNNQLNHWTIRFDQYWYLTYQTDTGSTTVNLGSAWPAMMVTEYYTGELSTTPVKSFTNFTSYRLSNTKTYDTGYSGNVSIDHYRIMKSGTAMSMAAVDTTVLNGTVPGAMFDASFNATSYFPNEEHIRIAFDSAAYVGSNVTVGTWTMDVDSVAFSGTFEINGTPYKVDLTQPWSLTWNEDGTVSIEFTESRRSGEKSVTILEERVSPTVNLGGQWAIDTDAYSVSSHVEDQYDFNFGHFGLDKTTFVVCCMGLTAIIAIAFKLGRVDFGLIDYIVLFGANAILWMVL